MMFLNKMKFIKDWLRKRRTLRIARKEKDITIPKYCEMPMCENKISLMSFRCHYCNKFYCSLHRLPEDHNCPKSFLPYSMKKGFGTKSYSIKDS